MSNQNTTTIQDNVTLVNQEIFRFVNLAKGFAYTQIFQNKNCEEEMMLTNIIAENKYEANAFFLKVILLDSEVLSKIKNNVQRDFDNCKLKATRDLYHPAGNVHGTESDEVRIERFKGALLANLMKHPEYSYFDLMNKLSFELKFHKAYHSFLKNIKLLKNAFDQLEIEGKVRKTEEILYINFTDYKIELIRRPDYELTPSVEMFHQQLVDQTTADSLVQFLREVMQYAGNCKVLESLIEKFSNKVSVPTVKLY